MAFTFRPKPSPPKPSPPADSTAKFKGVEKKYLDRLEGFIEYMKLDEQFKKFCDDLDKIEKL